MPRPPRITPVGMPFHVLNRGNERRTLFAQPRDFQRFIDRVEETVRRYPFSVLAYCLMTNHWHFVVIGHTDTAISDAFQWLSCGHACDLRRIEGTVGWGHVYQRRFSSFPVGSKRYLLNVIRYVEANARDAGLVSQAEDWRWGSLWDRLRTSRAILPPELPVRLPDDWTEIVNTPIKRTLRERIDKCVVDGIPYGPTKWAEQTSERLRLKMRRTKN